MDREEALKIVRENYPHFGTTKPLLDLEKALATLIPELAESDDERIRKRLIEYFEGFRMGNAEVKWEGLTVQDVLAYLEKQKENPKSADSIPSDCMSDAKCEDRWHKVTDSLPDNGRLVLAKDCLGNVLLARYDGENWEVDVYDNEDHYCHNSISKWCEIPSEKQKEQKPVHFELKAEKWYICHRAFCCRADHLTVKEGERFQCEKDGIVKGFVIKEPEKYFKECSAPAPMEDEQKEQKPSESISQLTVQGKGVYKICPRCKERMVRDNTKVYTSMPPQYGYKCPKCGEMEFDTVMYDNPEMEEQKPNSTEDMPYITDEHFYERESADSFKYKLAEYMTRCCTKKEGPYGYEYGISAESILKMAEEELLKRGVVQKPAEWSEEDETAFGDLMWCIERASKSAKDENDMGNIWFAENWVKNRLKSLRPNQPKQEWSEEDENVYKTIMDDFNGITPMSKAYKLKAAKWLKSILERCSLQPKQEWSEEDEEKEEKL